MLVKPTKTAVRYTTANLYTIDWYPAEKHFQLDDAALIVSRCEYSKTFICILFEENLYYVSLNSIEPLDKNDEATKSWLKESIILRDFKLPKLPYHYSLDDTVQDT